MSVRTLAPAAEIDQRAVEFRNALEKSLPNAAQLGRQLYVELFSDIPNDSATWLLALEGKLFGVPLAALVTGFDAGRPKYLVESRTIELVPGAWAVGSETAGAGNLFLGIGDPVYNRADPRYSETARPAMLASLFFWKVSAAPELARLIGSGREVQACARQWQGPFVILSGTEATRLKFEEAFRSQPAVIHFATHFVASQQAPDLTMIALGLQDRGRRSRELELLTSADVSALNIPGSIVVLSGCNSASGRSLPGAGLLGLTRAFLSAGARSVVATLWPTADDSGELFIGFYRRLRMQRGSGETAASALRSAQLEVLHTPGWRSSPQYWAAYQVTTRSSGTQ